MVFKCYFDICERWIPRWRNVPVGKYWAAENELFFLSVQSRDSHVFGVYKIPALSKLDNISVLIVILCRVDFVYREIAFQNKFDPTGCRCDVSYNSLIVSNNDVCLLYVYAWLSTFGETYCLHLQGSSLYPILRYKTKEINIKQE